MKDRKTKRLSFRISEGVSDRIDDNIEHNRDISDRSDFGQKAIEYYLDLLEGDQQNIVNLTNKITIMRDAILLMAENIQLGNAKEIMLLRKIE